MYGLHMPSQFIIVMLRTCIIQRCPLVRERRRRASPPWRWAERENSGGDIGWVATATAVGRWKRRDLSSSQRSQNPEDRHTYTQTLDLSFYAVPFEYVLLLVYYELYTVWSRLGAMSLHRSTQKGTSFRLCAGLIRITSQHSSKRHFLLCFPRHLFLLLLLLLLLLVFLLFCFFCIFLCLLFLFIGVQSTPPSIQASLRATTSLAVFTPMTAIQIDPFFQFVSVSCSFFMYGSGRLLVNTKRVTCERFLRLQLISAMSKFVYPRGKCLLAESLKKIKIDKTLNMEEGKDVVAVTPKLVFHIQGTDALPENSLFVPLFPQLFVYCILPHSATIDSRCLLSLSTPAMANSKYWSTYPFNFPPFFSSWNFSFSEKFPWIFFASPNWQHVAHVPFLLCAVGLNNTALDNIDDAPLLSTTQQSFFFLSPRTDVFAFTLQRMA